MDTVLGVLALDVFYTSFIVDRSVFLLWTYELYTVDRFVPGTSLRGRLPQLATCVLVHKQDL